MNICVCMCKCVYVNAQLLCTCVSAWQRQCASETFRYQNAYTCTHTYRHALTQQQKHKQRRVVRCCMLHMRFTFASFAYWCRCLLCFCICCCSWPLLSLLHPSLFLYLLLLTFRRCLIS